MEMGFSILYVQVTVQQSSQSPWVMIVCSALQSPPPGKSPTHCRLPWEGWVHLDAQVSPASPCWRFSSAAESVSVTSAGSSVAAEGPGCLIKTANCCVPSASSNGPSSAGHMWLSPLLQPSLASQNLGETFWSSFVQVVEKKCAFLLVVVLLFGVFFSLRCVNLRSRLKCLKTSKQKNPQ